MSSRGQIHIITRHYCDVVSDMKSTSYIMSKTRSVVGIRKIPERNGGVVCKKDRRRVWRKMVTYHELDHGHVRGERTHHPQLFQGLSVSLFPVTTYPLGAFLSFVCSCFVLTALEGTFSTSTNSFNSSIFPAVCGSCGLYTV